MRWILVLISVSVLVLAGCDGDTPDSDGGPGMDTGVRDSGPADAGDTDTGPDDDGGTDAGPPLVCGPGEIDCGGVCVDRGLTSEGGDERAAVVPWVDPSGAGVVAHVAF